MKRTLALALLTCLAAPAWADPPIPEWVRAASRCSNLTPSCHPFADVMSDADLAVFRYLTVYNIFDLPRKERQLAVDKVEKAVAAARSRSKTAVDRSIGTTQLYAVDRNDIPRRIRGRTANNMTADDRMIAAPLCTDCDRIVVRRTANNVTGTIIRHSDCHIRRIRLRHAPDHAAVRRGQASPPSGQGKRHHKREPSS